VLPSGLSPVRPSLALYPLPKSPDLLAGLAYAKLMPAPLLRLEADVPFKLFQSNPPLYCWTTAWHSQANCSSLLRFKILTARRV
jgi:hypothetical protein